MGTGSIGNPTIVSGAKGPRDINMLASANDVAAFVKPREEGEVIFRSRFKNFMLTLKAPVKRSIGDEILNEPARKVRFKDYVYRTSDPWEIEKIRKSNRFGLSLDFWDQSEAIAIAEEARYQDFVRTLDANPKLKERLIVDAGLRDFKVSKPKE